MSIRAAGKGSGPQPGPLIKLDELDDGDPIFEVVVLPRWREQNLTTAHRCLLTIFWCRLSGKALDTLRLGAPGNDALHRTGRGVAYAKAQDKGCRVPRPPVGPKQYRIASPTGSQLGKSQPRSGAVC